MMSPQEKIQWAVGFSKEALGELSDRAWKRLKYQLFNFVGGQITLDEEWTVAKAKEVQEQAKAMLQAWANLNEIKNFKPGTKRHTFDGVQVSVKGIDTVRFRFVEPGVVEVTPILVTSLSRAFSFCLAFSLGGIDTTLIRKCPSCRAVFLASHGRQKFCDRRCKWREKSAKYRGEHFHNLKVRAYQRAEKKGRE